MNRIESNKMQFAHNCIDFCVSQFMAIEIDCVSPRFADRTKGYKTLIDCPAGIINSIHAEIAHRWH